MNGNSLIIFLIEALNNIFQNDSIIIWLVFNKKIYRNETIEINYMMNNTGLWDGV